jgi:hypothetical protein
MAIRPVGGSILQTKGTFMKKINLSTVLLILGIVAQFGPDVASVSAWLTGLGVAWLVLPAKIVGAVALVLSALPLIIARLRPLLAAVGLATPPGALAPWVPGKPGDPELQATPLPKPPAEVTPVTKPETPSAKGAKP